MKKAILYTLAAGALVAAGLYAFAKLDEWAAAS